VESTVASEGRDLLALLNKLSEKDQLRVQGVILELEMAHQTVQPSVLPQEEVRLRAARRRAIT